MLEKVQVEVREWSGRLRSLACLLGLFTVTFPEPTQGHNGAVALAVPVTGITVDGDLSDWPQDMVSYPIRETNFASQPHSDFRDLEASFRIGYSATEGALYIGVEVHDDSVIVTAPGGGPIDACTILLTSSHDLGTRPGSRAERLSHLNSIDLHGKSVSIEGSIPATAVRSATIGDAHEISYEVRIDLSWSAYTDLDAALSLGFDILLNDTDGDGTIQTVSWGPGRSKRPFVNRIGDVMLLPAGQAGIPLVGLATWANGSPISFASIQVQSTHSPRLWCTVATDTSGSFRVTLRPDEYRITLQDPAGSTTTVDMRLGQLSHTRVQAPLPTGVRQVAGPGTEHWQTFDVTDGVASNSVKVLEQGRDGILWLGTEAGLTRYDGRKFISYTRSDGLTQQWIHDLAEDQHGDLWIAAGNVGGWDLFLFDGTAFTSLRDSLGLTEMVGSLHSDRVGNMWIGTEGAGLSRWDGSRLETFTTAGGLSNNLVNDIWEDASGGIWIATISGVDYWNGQNLVHHRPDEIGSTRIVRQDQSGDMWYVGGRGLLRSRHGRLETVSLDEGPTPLVLSSLQEDRHGRMWVGTLSGIRRLDMDGTISTFTQGHGLAFDAVVDLLEDRDGHMWAATGWFGMGGGVTRFSGDRFVTFGVTDGLPTSNIGQTIQDTDGHVWMAASQSQHNIMSGLTRYDGSSFTSWNKAGGLRGERPKLLSVGSDIWVGTQRFDGVTFQYYEPSSGSSAWGLARRPATGDLWMAVWSSGVAHVEGRHLVPFTGIEDPHKVLPRTLAWDRDDRLWIGTWFGGLYRWNPATGETRHFGVDDGLEDEGIMTVIEDRDGRLWVGTWSGGVSWLDGERFITLTQRDGLAGNWVTDIVRDQRDRYVISTLGGGISLYDGLVMQTLTRADGLGGNVVQDVMEDNRGDLWLSTTTGLTRYRPGTTSPAVQITGIQADREYDPTAEVSLPTTQDLLTISFEGRSFLTTPDRLAYVYRLKGYDDEWRVTRDEEVVYQDLPLGDYHFEVKAVDGELSYSDAGNVPIVVHLAYGRIVMTAALVLAVAGLIIAGRYGLGRRHERDLARTELLQERRRHIEVKSHEIDQWTVDDFVGTSPGLQAVLNRIRDLQAEDGRVLITGEAGTGKELVALAVHSGSRRRDRPFVPVRCAGLPRAVESLDQRTQVLSLLFGHTQGAFTGADEDHEGLVQQAEGGILFLDEVGLLPLPTQAHLLRVLGQGEVRRTGSQDGEQVDLRVLASTSEDLQLQVEMGTFNGELYDFLAVESLHVPPLRERREDIAPLAQHLVDDAARQHGSEPQPLAPELLAQLQERLWPENVRELAQHLREIATTGARPSS